MDHKNYTDRQVSTIKWMDDKRFIANVYDSSHSIARMKCSCGTGYILYGTMIVTMFDFLEQFDIEIIVTIKNLYYSNNI